MAYEDGYYYGQCKIICESETVADNGRTVAVTDGNNTWSKALVDKRAEFLVPGRNKYTITLLDGSVTKYTRDIEVGYGDCVYAILAKGYEPISSKDFNDFKASTEEAINELSEKMDVVEPTVASHTNAINSLNTTVSGHTTSINNLNTSTSNNKKSIDSLNSTVNGHTTSINGLNSTVGGHTSSINSLNTNVTSLQNQLKSGSTQFRFGITSDGRYGYKKAGADTVTPFLSGATAQIQEITLIYSNAANAAESTPGQVTFEYTMTDQMKNYFDAFIYAFAPTNVEGVTDGFAGGLGGVVINTNKHSLSYNNFATLPATFKYIYSSSVKAGEKVKITNSHYYVGLEVWGVKLKTTLY